MEPVPLKYGKLATKIFFTVYKHTKKTPAPIIYVECVSCEQFCESCAVGRHWSPVSVSSACAAPRARPTDPVQPASTGMCRWTGRSCASADNRQSTTQIHNSLYWWGQCLALGTGYNPHGGWKCRRWGHWLGTAFWIYFTALTLSSRFSESWLRPCRKPAMFKHSNKQQLNNGCNTQMYHT